MRQLHLLAGVTTQEGVVKLQERLVEEVGEIYVHALPAQATLEINSNEPDPALEREKLEALRASILRAGR
ncbi:hypothetical protein [Pararhizobium qamdonense]|uniref:hypothetical protein n=1 Tax=Pararhizobium qamdonense TaxID=3031126 RepID=UPI0023E2EE14|nr:hypothetical protein [Pararhizobium qamdonense]